MRLKKSLPFLKIWLAKLPIVFFLLILTGMVYFLQSDFWNIKKISCFEEESLCPAEVYGDLSSLVIGRHLLFLTPKKITTQILSRYPFFKEIKIAKKIPPEVQFRLKTREPLVAMVKQMPADEYFLIDEDGYILTKAKTSELPLVLVQELPAEAVGQKIGQNSILKAVEILKELKMNLFEPKIARINPYNIEVWFKDNELAVFSIFKELKIQINSLQLILTRAKIEGKIIKRIDLRFDKPVVVYD